ncbi:MAG: hypothetical protein U5K37_08055 [Natrialbaceae archaeon]|nr:hypothetical protein [Natrialbaceae archaeon]
MKRVLEERQIDIWTGVATPIVELHESVSEFERQLEAGPLEPGFGRQLAARLYAIGWARGYAQYGGAPIAEVIANRHVEVMTNDAIMATQRAVFGTADPRGPDAQRRAWLCLAAKDAQELYDRETPPGVDASAVCNHLAYIYGDVDGTLPDPPTVQGLAGSAPGLDAEDNITVGHSADFAFRSLLEDGGESSIREAIDRVHRVRVTSDITTAGGAFTGFDIRPPPAVRSDPNWTAAPPDRTTETVDTAVRRDSSGTYDTFTLSLTNEFSETQRWHDANGSTISRHASTRRTFRATITIDGAESPGATTPDRVQTEYEAGPPDWHHRHDLLHTEPTNFASIPSTATARLVDQAPVASLEQTLASRGETVSSAADLRGLLADSVEPAVTLEADPPLGIRAWVAADLLTLRDRIAAESITVDRASLVAPGGSPVRELIARLESRRAALVTSGPYANVADRSRHEARDVYLQAVIADLEQVAEAHETATAALDDELAGANDGLGDATALIRSTLGASEPAPGQLPTPSFTPNYTVGVAGSPTYLTREPVTSDRVAAIESNATFAPLAVRTTNHFSIPYDAIVGGILSRIPLPYFDLEPDGAEVPLRTAGEALQAATVAHELAPGQVGQPGPLETAVADEMDRLVTEVALELAPVLDVDATLLLDALQSGLAASGSDVASRAVALGDGEASDRMATVAGLALSDDRPASYDAAPETWPGMVVSVVRPTIDRRVGNASVTVASSQLEALDGAVRSAVNETATRVISDRLSGNDSRLADVWLNTSVNASPNRIPAGLPILPVPGYWAVTANVWDIDVSGQYRRFELRSRVGPTAGPGGLTYVRERQPVTVTINGTVHHLGWTDPVDFDGGTTVVVVVPPGGIGVGDRTGDRTRCSPSFPEVGRVDNAMTSC